MIPIPPLTPATDRCDLCLLYKALRVVLGGYGRAPSSDPKEQLRATEWLGSFRSKDDTWDACIAGDTGQSDYGPACMCFPLILTCVGRG